MLVSTFTHLMTPCEAYILEWEKQPLLHCYSISISLHQYIFTGFVVRQANYYLYVLGEDNFLYIHNALE